MNRKVKNIKHSLMDKTISLYIKELTNYQDQRKYVISKLNKFYIFVKEHQRTDNLTTKDVMRKSLISTRLVNNLKDIREKINFISIELYKLKKNKKRI